MKFLTSIDLVQNELQNAVIQNLAVSPASGVKGQVYFNTTDNYLYRYDGTEWGIVGKKLDIASATTLGGVKIGYGLSIKDDGTLDVTGAGKADSVDWENVLGKPTDLAGYGIVDAKIDKGVITLGANTITPITTVNGKTGSTVTLTAADVKALADDTTYVESVDGQSGAVTLSDVKYTKQTLTDEQKQIARENIGAGVSNFSGSYNDLTNKPTIDAALSSTSTNAVENQAVTKELAKKYDETNQPPYPVTSVAGKTGAVILDKTDVGLDKVANVLQYSAENEPPYPVTSVDGETGAVVLNDVKYTAQTLTEEQKTQARTNIGAGTSSFDGNYNNLTNKPVVDTEMKDDSTNAVQNKVIKAYVDSIVVASQGLRYKGTLNAPTEIPTTYEVGDLYVIGTAGTYVGQKCEVGDMMIALVARKGTGNENTDWDIVQTNIDGAITELTGDAPISVTGTGASREIALENSGVTTGGYGDTANQTPAFGATFKVPSFTVDQYGRLTAAGEHTVTVPSTVATDAVAGIMSAADHKKLTDGLADVSTLTSDVDTLKTKDVTKVTATITAGQTSATATVASGVDLLSTMATNATTGEQVMVDTIISDTTFTATIAKAVGYNVKVAATVL